MGYILFLIIVDRFELLLYLVVLLFILGEPQYAFAYKSSGYAGCFASCDDDHIS